MNPATRFQRRRPWRHAIAIALIAVALLLTVKAGLLLSGPSEHESAAAACVDETDAAASMEQGIIRFGDDQRLIVRIAATPSQRAAGMQRLCPDAIADTPMLFLFDSPQQPRFHMNNVHAPLDIVFVRQDGSIVAIDRMTPGQTHLTAPPESITAALELAAGGAERLGLMPGQRLAWDWRTDEEPEE